MCLMGKIDQFLRDTQMPPTKFGRLAVRDPRLVGDMKRGREPGPQMTRRVETFIDTYAAETRI